MSIRLSAGVVVVRNVQGSWLFLMLRAYRNWDFPKGLVEPGELDPDHVITPGIFVKHIIQCSNYEKRIEKRTMRR